MQNDWSVEQHGLEGSPVQRFSAQVLFRAPGEGLITVFQVHDRTTRPLNNGFDIESFHIFWSTLVIPCCSGGKRSMSCN